MTPRTKREYLRELVADKSQWTRPLTDKERSQGFLGWHERGFLPHCDYPGLVQFITTRLADSLPAARRGEWEHLLAIGDNRERRAELEEYLDRGGGECRLREARVAKLCEEALLHFHNDRYELLAWCVMPNHVHVLVHVWDLPVWKMIASWKRFSAARINGTAPNRSSAPQKSFWEREYWDTFMRSEEQEKKAVQYIEANPVKAKLCQTAEEWPFSSARHRDKYRKLVLPAKP